MKNTFRYWFVLALLAVSAPLGVSRAQTVTTFFSDNFSTSTTNLISTPGGYTGKTATSTSYDMATTKQAYNVTIGPNLLHLTLTTGTTSAILEAQALFATNAISLNASNDYIEIDVVFTNTADFIYNGSANGSALYLGLFNSGSTFGVTTNWPVPFGGLWNAGLSTAGNSPLASGNCELWQGYVAQVLSNSAPKIITRPIQNGSGTTSANQELLANNAGSGTFNNPSAAVLFQGATTNITLTPPPPAQAYTMQLRITLGTSVAPEFLVISNALYSGAGTGGTQIFSQITTNTSGANFLSDAFDGLSVGVRSSSASGDAVNPVLDISSITVSGVSTPPTGPPTITQMPTPVQVVSGGSCDFTVSAFGDNVTYQWFRNTNQKLSNGSNISGATSDQLVISPAGPADQFTGPNNGYYCVVTGAGPFSTNTVTNTLTLITSTNLVYGNQVGNGFWSINDSVLGANWVDQNNNQAVFNYGDPVTFDDSQAGSGGVVVVSNIFTAPISVTVSNFANFYEFSGPGAIAGPTPLWYVGGNRLTFTTPNTYSGGTLISNATAYVLLQNLGGMGSGPVTLGLAGGQIEVAPAGSATAGIEGTVNVKDNFTIEFDTVNAFAGVFLGDLTGTVGKTLTLSPTPSINPDNGQVRVRLYGGNTVYNGNINLSDPNILMASYMPSGSQTFNGIISGPGGFMQKGITTTLNGANTYTGGTYPAQGAIGIGASSTVAGGGIGTGPILLGPDSSSSLTGNGFIFATIPNLVVSNAVQYESGTNNLNLDIGGSQNITMDGPFTFYGNDLSKMTAFPTRTLEVTNTGLTILNGVISDGGSNYNFNLTGSGITLFNQTEAWGGTSTNLGGTMLVNGTVGPGLVFITTNTTLGGNGTISGPVIVGGTLTAGSQTVAGSQGIGTLHITGDLTLQSTSTNFIEVNTASATTHDSFVVGGALTIGGTLWATNLGPTLAANTQFTIYPGSPAGTFANIVGSPGPGQTWSYSAGVLSVVGSSAPPPFTVRPYIGSIALSGTNIVLTGTNAQSGDVYYTLMTTNLSLPLSQWLVVATNVSSTANNYSMIITNAVNPKDTQQFYIFSSVP